MRKLRLVSLSFLLFSMLIGACGTTPPAPSKPGSPTLDLGKIVQATLAALTAQASSVSPTSAPVPPTPAKGKGTIVGTLTYPADSLPPMYVVAYQVGTQHYQSITTKAGQSTYELSGLAPGTYHVIAYTIGGGGFPAGFAGGYTAAVPCGLAAECANHALIDVPVAAGKTVTGINPSDWYAPPGTFLAFPGQAAVPTASPSAAYGGVAGSLMYPASALPALRVVAFQIGSAAYFYTETAPGQSTYQINNLPAATYHVVAYVIPGGGFTGGLAGGYSQMVPCGLKYGCNDHTLIDVVVTAGHVTAGVDPNDYYADAGTFPPDPAP